jgi:hypothetical protein
MDQWVAEAALRWTRAAVLAATGVIAGSLFHAAADGRHPGSAAVLAIWVVSTVAAAPLLGAELGTTRVVALLVAWQAGVHAALGGLGGHAPAAAPAGDHTAHAAHVDPGAIQVLIETLSAHAPMALGHAAAAALVGLWLAAGERALWSLLALSQQRLGVVAANVLRSWWWLPGGITLSRGADGPLARSATPPPRLRDWLLAVCLGRRGPPVFC